MIDVPILVKDALRDGRRLKNYRILVLNDDGTTDFVIDNNTLVSETVDIDERMCSGDTIKFGLCEGSSLEFQYFNKPNIYNRRLNVFVDVLSDYYEEGPAAWHDETTLSSDNKSFIIQNAGTYKLEWYGSRAFDITWTTNGTSHTDRIFPIPGEQTYDLGDMIVGDTITLSSERTINPIDLKGYYGIRNYWYTIPMGFFQVKKCARQASTGIMKASAYNKLQSDYLDAKANSLLAGINPDSGDGESTLYNIKSMLLKDYNIQEVDFVPFKIRYISSSSGSFILDTNAKLKNDSRTWSLKVQPCILSEFGNLLPGYNDHFYGLCHNLADYINALQGIYDDLIDALNRDLSNASAVITRIMPYFYEQLSIEFQFDDKTVYYTIDSLAEVATPRYESSIIKPMSELIESNINNFTRGTINLFFRIWMDTGTYPSYETHDVLTYSDRQMVTIFELLDGQIEYTNIINLEKADRIVVDINQMPDFTLRQITSAIYETVCQFGKLDRITDYFSGVELNSSRLYPAENLYPENTLYPDGAALSSEKSMYSKLWGDEGNLQKWRYLIITYKGLDEEQKEKEFTLQRTVNADGTQDYNMSDNWIFKNLIWTAAQVGEYADAMVAKMRNMTWFPYEMWCAGLPYLETGDEIEISIGQNTYTSYILQRQLKGIQNLQDTYINGTLDIF